MSQLFFKISIDLFFVKNNNSLKNSLIFFQLETFFSIILITFLSELINISKKELISSSFTISNFSTIDS
jgi:hypothetical protein